MRTLRDHPNCFIATAMAHVEIDADIETMKELLIFLQEEAVIHIHDVLTISPLPDKLRLQTTLDLADMNKLKVYLRGKGYESCPKRLSSLQQEMDSAPSTLTESTTESSVAPVTGLTSSETPSSIPAKE